MNGFVVVKMMMVIDVFVYVEVMEVNIEWEVVCEVF